MKHTRKIVDALLVAVLLSTSLTAYAENQTSNPNQSQEQPPAMVEEINSDGQRGQPPAGSPPSGMPGGFAPGGSQQPDSYTAVITVEDGEAAITEDVASTGTDENAILVAGGAATVKEITIDRSSDDSTGGDSASFYGVGAAVLTTGGTVTVEDAVITTDSRGGAGVFAYGEGIAVVQNTAITTMQDASGGIHVAGGGTLYAENCTVETYGGSSAAIRSDRGSGTMVVTGGSYVSHGSGSPAVYVTADITISGAELVATGSEALCLEGLNTVRLLDSVLSGSMPDDEQNDNTWTVILYQSMSGDSQVGKGSFLMDGGELISTNGGLFYTTNTDSEFTLRNVKITAADDCEYFLRATGNNNARGWGTSGSNGANCLFTAISQEMTGNVIWDSISTLDMYVTDHSTFTGAVVDDESCAGAGGEGACTLTIDETSTWIVTGDSVLTTLHCAGTLMDDQGRSVSIRTADGETLVEGESQYVITVASYDRVADVSDAASIG